jgi:hypothetical protein
MSTARKTSARRCSCSKTESGNRRWPSEANTTANEFGAGEAVLYAYGPDADALIDAVRKSLTGFRVRAGAYAIKRYGRADDPNSTEERVELP